MRRKPGNQESHGTEPPPVVVQGFKRHVTDMLEAERRRLEEKVVDLAENEDATHAVDKDQDVTIEELQALRKQLEQLQRDLSNL